MRTVRRAYVDSCLSINRKKRAAPQADSALRWREQNTDATLCISPLVRLETLDKPMRLHQPAIIAANESLLAAGPMAVNVLA